MHTPHASPHHMRGTQYTAERRSRGVVLLIPRPQTTKSMRSGFGFGIFVIWCGLERFTRLFASDGKVMWGARLNEDWRRESFGWNLINASPRSVWGTRCDPPSQILDLAPCFPPPLLGYLVIFVVRGAMCMDVWSG